MIRELSGRHWECKEWLLKEPSHLSNQTSSIYLHKLGDMICAKGFSNQQISSSFAIHFITGGTGSFKTIDQTYEVSSGDLFMFFPGHFYQYAIRNCSRWDYIWINMGGSNLLNILNDLGFNHQKPLIQNVNQELLKSLLNSCKSGLGYSTPLQSSPIQLAWSTIEYLEKTKIETPSHLDLAEQVKWLIDNDSYNSITINELADQLEYTRATIYRLFKDKYGISPKDYIDKIKIEKASDMLLNTSCPIKEISFSLGFSNPNYFARAFRKHTSVNPKEFRLNHQTS